MFDVCWQQLLQYYNSLLSWGSVIPPAEDAKKREEATCQECIRKSPKGCTAIQMELLEVSQGILAFHFSGNAFNHILLTHIVHLQQSAFTGGRISLG